MIQYSIESDTQVRKDIDCFPSKHFFFHDKSIEIKELERALQDKTKSEEEKRAIVAQHEADRLRFEAERERMRQESEQRRRVRLVSTLT